MDFENLSQAFVQIDKKISPDWFLKETCNKIIDKTISRNSIDEILAKEDVNYSIAKVGFLHLIFEYIKTALADNVLTTTEKENIKFLKMLFRIQPGDFYLHNKADIESTIAFQLSTIYQDSFVTDEEALLKVDLQEIFDLSFDEMNEYSKTEAFVSIQKGADPKNLDVFFTQKEFFKIK